MGDSGLSTRSTSLDGQTVVVIGGASGIGRACVSRLAEEGAAVVIVDRDTAGQHAAGRGT